MLPGFSFRETMSGSYFMLDAPTDERAIAFTIEARASDVARFARDKTWGVRGTIDAEKLASGADVEGTLTFKLIDERRLPYRLAFRGDDGKRYELSGQKEWMGLQPIASMTLLPASVYDDHGEEIARATLRFDLRSDWGRWLRSFRLHLFG
jgi:hypothetical protein